MTRAVFDSTVLVSAFLTKGGPSAELLREAAGGSFTLCLAVEILDETKRVLLDYPRIRKRYAYRDAAALEYVNLLNLLAEMIADLPSVRAVARDPNDDMVIACAIKAGADHIISRDKDLLDLRRYHNIQIASPEEFIRLLRR